MKAILTISFILILISANFAQSDSINNILDGKWTWINWNPAYYKCFEEPSNTLSRNIIFSLIKNSDSIAYQVLKNDIEIFTGNTLIRETIHEDIVFGYNADSPFLDNYPGYIITLHSDTTLTVRLGTSRSSTCYNYQKEIKVNNSNSYLNHNNQIKTIYSQSNKIVIEFYKTNHLSDVCVRLYDISGKTVLTKDIIPLNIVTVDIPIRINNGLYFICASSNKSDIFKSKLNINRL